MTVNKLGFDVKDLTKMQNVPISQRVFIFRRLSNNKFGLNEF